MGSGERGCGSRESADVLIGLAPPILATADLPSAARWYESVLGMVPVDATPASGRVALAAAHTPLAEICLELVARDGVGAVLATRRAAFLVTDAGEVFARAVAAGATTMERPTPVTARSGGVECLFADRDDNVISVRQPSDSAARAVGAVRTLAESEEMSYSLRRMTRLMRRAGC